MEQLGFNLDRYEANRLLALADKDGDGTLDLEEFADRFEGLVHASYARDDAREDG